MKKRFISIVMVVLICLMSIPMAASASESTSTVDFSIDYTAEIIKAINSTDTEYAFHAAATFEQLRNYKIDSLGWNDKYSKHYFFQGDYTWEEAVQLFKEDSGLAPKPTPTPEPTLEPTPEPVVNTDPEEEILAKLLYCEAGSMGWQGQVYVCSAILNLRDYSGRSIWNMAHDVNTFAVAGYVDYAMPLSTQYEVISYVLNGGRVPEIKYFRTDYYHSFGTPVCNVENVYFSK